MFESLIFVSAPEIAWQVVLKTEAQLELLTDTDMLLTIKKGIRGTMYHTVHQYAKANNKCMKEHDQNKESPYLMY